MMNDNNKIYKDADLDYSDEIQEEKSKKAKSAMKDIDKELKSLKKIEFKDFSLIMDDYHSGNKYREDKAKEDACLNLKGYIIYMIMHSFWTYCKNYFFDMLQSGYVGVLKGLEVYDPTKAMPTTFFKPYIRYEITRFITEFLNGSTVHYATTLAKVKKAQHHFEELGVECKDSAIAEYLGISPTSVREALASQEAAINVNYQDQFENSSDDDAPSITGEFSNPEKYLESKLLHEAIAEAINELNKNEKLVIVSLYGLEGEAKSIKQISEETGMSQSMLKTIRQEAINKLYSSKLRELYDDRYKGLEGVETYEFMPPCEADIDIVEFTFEDFVDAKTAAENDFLAKPRGEKYVPVLSNNQKQSNISLLSGM